MITTHDLIKNSHSNKKAQVWYIHFIMHLKEMANQNSNYFKEKKG